MSNSNSGSTEAITANMLRFAGYGLLLLALANFGEALIPPRFGQDPAWELGTLAKLAGSSPVPIIGMVLVFYGESTARSPLGKTILKILSWLSLLLGIVYIVMTLIGISAAIRINNDNNNQASAVATQQLTQFNNAKENLKNTDDENLKKAAEFIERRSPNIKLNKENATELRTQLAAEIAKGENDARRELEDRKARAFRQLIKQAAKSYFEALVSAVIFIGLWNQTKWTRSVVKKRKKKGAKSDSVSLSDIASAPTLETETTKPETEE
jgi:hypothetical protein